MRNIIAIGGGELSQNETIKLDRFIVSLAKKDKPRVLFIPTASHDAQGYIDAFDRVYSSLGCEVSVLRLAQNVNVNAVRSAIFSADIIYVGGGNTAYMMSVWRRYRVDEMLKTAYERGIILSGLSAGTIAFCKSGYSDSNPEKMSFVRGLSFIPLTVCPHYDEPERADFDAEIGTEKAVALENLTAMVYTDSVLSFARCDDKHSAYIFDTTKTEVTEWIHI